MAKRHWLDPLARRLLIATGQIATPAGAPRTPPAAGRAAPLAAGTPEAGEQVERDLLELRLRIDPAQPLRNQEDVLRAAALGWRLDVNRATAPDWLRLPGCTPAQVDLLQRLQASGIQLSGIEDLQRVLDLDGPTLRCWQPLLEFRWYGEPPPSGPPAAVPVNRADSGQLETLPGMEPRRVERLMQERARRSFADLADLQQRLQLPPAVVEGWIGRVSFEPGPAGPVLPPAGRSTR